MGSLENPGATSNRHRSCKLLRFWENRIFFCILATDRQTDHLPGVASVDIVCSDIQWTSSWCGHWPGGPIRSSVILEAHLHSSYHIKTPFKWIYSDTGNSLHLIGSNGRSFPVNLRYFFFPPMSKDPAASICPYRPMVISLYQVFPSYHPCESMLYFF